MKRFWKAVEVERVEGGWTVRLDERVLKTPAQQDLVVPSEALAQAIAAEWRAVEDKVDPRALPMTGLANAAIDRIAPDKERFAAELSAYAANELFCYRADYPRSLAEREEAEWDPLLDWARDHYEIDFVTTARVMHVEQPPETIATLAAAVANEDPFVLAGLSPMVRNGGSLVAALAVRHGAVAPPAAWAATDCHRRHQVEQWGDDPEGERASAARRVDFMTGARFLELL
ncbi:ATP12 family chaperone protein [Sphingomicrobium astaxanthinifaciens]|uniref:ATP12 family chaperone protein n=1 Tax=Sphingomicrobium astaxanthinifaciens TaxID=1227949 RepID=UPI001FCC4C4C|nr:ATP12 family protein [Sphingomicrobium astaxanthinifaciens]MCJ7420846.1 ATPase [Sphingomicrobium astaxanthinifaciens]